MAVLCLVAHPNRHGVQVAIAPLAAPSRVQAKPPGRKEEAREVREGGMDGAATTGTQHGLVGSVPQATGIDAMAGESCRRWGVGAHRCPSPPRAVDDVVTKSGDLKSGGPTGTGHVRAVRALCSHVET